MVRYASSLRRAPAQAHSSGSTVLRRDLRCRSSSARPLSAVRGPAPPDCSRLLPPHGHRCGVRWLHPRAPLSVPLLQAHRFAAAGFCFALSPFQYSRDLPVSHRPSAEWLHSPGCRQCRRATWHALPARPVLGPPFSKASRWAVRSLDGVDHSHTGAGLPHQGLAHAPSRGLDRCAPLPVFRIARPPVGLAALSRSRRASRRIPAGVAIHLTAHTQHLHRARRVSRVSSSHGRQS